MAKIIGIIPAKNEAWIIEKALVTLTSFCDHVIVGLDDCTDSTEQICNGYSNVIVIKNERHASSLSQILPNRRQILLEQAREISANPIILAVDADEIFSSEILNEENLADIRALEPGFGFSLRFRELWFSPHVYRSEATSSWSGRKMPCIWRDDGTNYPAGNRHEVRMPEGISCKEASLDLMHFARVLPIRYWSRMRHYIAYEIMILKKPPYKTNFFYSITRDEAEMRLAPTPDNWTEKWVLKDELFMSFHETSANWFNDEVLDLILEEDSGCLDKADIWDFDWVEYYKVIKGVDPSPLEKKKLDRTIPSYIQKVVRHIRENRSYPVYLLEYWNHLAVRVLQKLNLYQRVYSFIKK